MANRNFQKMLFIVARSRFLLVFISLVIGVFIGLLFRKDKSPMIPAEAAPAVHGITMPGGLQGSYKLINPLLLIETPEAAQIKDVSPLHDEIQKFIDSAIENKQADKVSVYFRDSNKGWWFGINEDEKYNPGSLVKVPLMIAVLKLAEANPAILKKQLTYDGSFDDNKREYFAPQHPIVAGRSYSVEELIYFMVVDSDNNAYQLLLKNTDSESVAEVYADLGVSIPDSKNPATADFMTVKSYAYFFRVLYNATYLTTAHSEKAMELLSEAYFSQGIASSVPPTIPVANKFGERTIFNGANGKTTRQLHDCGYVYYPNHRPYLICIMTRGGSFDTLIPIIQNISRMSYNWMQQEYK